MNRPACCARGRPQSRHGGRRSQAAVGRGSRPGRPEGGLAEADQETAFQLEKDGLGSVALGWCCVIRYTPRYSIVAAPLIGPCQYTSIDRSGLDHLHVYFLPLSFTD